MRQRFKKLDRVMAGRKKSEPFRSILSSRVVPRARAVPIGRSVKNGIVEHVYAPGDYVVEAFHATKGHRRYPQVLVLNTYRRAGVNV